MGEKYRAKRIEPGLYNYRGALIIRDLDTPAGFWGAWCVGGMHRNAPAFGLMRDAKEYVDAAMLTGRKFTCGTDEESERK